MRAEAQQVAKRGREVNKQMAGWDATGVSARVWHPSKHMLLMTITSPPSRGHTDDMLHDHLTATDVRHRANHAII